MKRFSVSVLVLIIFVLAYVLCTCAYTFISGLNDKKLYLEWSELSRIRRDLTRKIDSWPNNISFNVCCDRDEYLGAQLECVKITGGNRTSPLAETAIVDEDLFQSPIDSDRIIYKYGVKEICAKDEIRVVTWSEAQPYSYYISKKNGYLLQLSDDRKTVVSNYATSSFCLDYYNNSPENFYMALLCPCKEKVCVQKCCPEGFYYNTASSRCKELEDGVAAYKPNFPEDVPYLLEINVPRCNGPDKMILDEEEPAPLKILESGHLMMSADENDTFDRKKYCVDTFSDGKNNFSYTNGFYCPKETKRLLTHENMIPQKINERMFSSVSRNSVNFGLIFVNLYFLFLYVVV